MVLETFQMTWGSSRLAGERRERHPEGKLLLYDFVLGYT